MGFIYFKDCMICIMSIYYMYDIVYARLDFKINSFSYIAYKIVFLLMSLLYVTYIYLIYSSQLHLFVYSMMFADIMSTILHASLSIMVCLSKG